VRGGEVDGVGSDDSSRVVDRVCLRLLRPRIVKLREDPMVIQKTVGRGVNLAGGTSRLWREAVAAYNLALVVDAEGCRSSSLLTRGVINLRVFSLAEEETVRAGVRVAAVRAESSNRSLVAI
jgi:hypothetical protein